MKLNFIKNDSLIKNISILYHRESLINSSVTLSFNKSDNSMYHNSSKRHRVTIFEDVEEIHVAVDSERCRSVMQEYLTPNLQYLIPESSAFNKMELLRMYSA